MSREEIVASISEVLSKQDAELGVVTHEGLVLVYFRDAEHREEAQVHELEPLAALKLAATLVAVAEQAIEHRKRGRTRA